MDKKDLTKQYKNRIVKGGVYVIKNGVSGRCYLSYAVNLQSAVNRFNFMTAANSCTMLPLQADFEKHGADSFSFEVLDEIEKSPEQTSADFDADLNELCEIYKLRFPTESFY